jgi:hypothetical protein
VIVSVVVELPAQLPVRATGEVVEVENERGRGLAVVEDPAIVCDTYGHRMQLPRWQELACEGAMVAEAERRLARGEAL